MNTYIINEQNCKLTGRGTWDEDKIYWCALSGSGFECRFKGREFILELVGDAAPEKPGNDENWARYAVFVNGIRTTEGLLDRVTKTVPVICGSENSKETEADIKFIKLSESAKSTIGIKPVICDGVMTPAPEKPLKLEIIGDSITCGYGVDEYDPLVHFRTSTEDFTKSYAYKVGQLLDADVRAFSISGWGIISGYVDSPDMPPLTTNLLPPYYTKLGFSDEKFDDRDGLAPQDIDWDFTKYIPGLIVINLGTNDFSWCMGHEDRYAEYTAEYVKFLETVHKCNPSSKILCIMGIMVDEIYPYMEKAVELFREKTGFKEIYTARFTPHDGSLGFGADYHPSPATHDKAAKVLAEKIREIMKV
ncbi:MAG: GDSL family lipase [Ruminiclostridium sp.]|nr:GDSL family lipase [Ruminiclostridium sp.]